MIQAYAGSESASVIAGLPEAPISGVFLKNVKINAHKGMIVSYADVSGENVVIQAAEGSPILKLAGGKLSLR